MKSKSNQSVELRKIIVTHKMFFQVSILRGYFSKFGDIVSLHANQNDRNLPTFSRYHSYITYRHGDGLDALFSATSHVVDGCHVSVRLSFPWKGGWGHKEKWNRMKAKKNSEGQYWGGTLSLRKVSGLNEYNVARFLLSRGVSEFYITLNKFKSHFMCTLYQYLPGDFFKKHHYIEIQGGLRVCLKFSRWDSYTHLGHMFVRSHCCNGVRVRTKIPLSSVSVKHIMEKFGVVTSCVKFFDYHEYYEAKDYSSYNVFFRDCRSVKKVFDTCRSPPPSSSASQKKEPVVNLPLSQCSWSRIDKRIAEMTVIDSTSDIYRDCKTVLMFNLITTGYTPFEILDFFSCGFGPHFHKVVNTKKPEDSSSSSSEEEEEEEDEKESSVMFVFFHEEVPFERVKLKGAEKCDVMHYLICLRKKIDLRSSVTKLSRSYITLQHPQLQKQQQQQELSIMSYNVLADSYTWKEFFLHLLDNQDLLSWKYRGPKLMEEIRSFGSDVICLQEVDKVADFSAGLPREYKFVFHSRPNLKDGCLTAWNSRRVQLIKHFVINVDLLSKFKKRRVVLICLFRFLSSSGGGSSTEAKHFYVLNSHQHVNEEFAKDHIRGVLKELERIRKKYAQQLVKSNRSPVFFCGDFNQRPKEGVYLMMQKNNFESAYKTLETETDEKKKKKKKALNTYFSSYPKMIDYIFYKNAECASVLDLPREKVLLPNEYHCSDHVPIIGKFKLL